MIDWINLNDNYLKEISEATLELEARLTETEAGIDDLKRQIVFAIGQGADDRDLIEQLEEARAEQRFTYAELLGNTIVRKLLEYKKTDTSVFYFSSPPQVCLSRSLVYQNLLSPQSPVQTRIPDCMDIEPNWREYMMHEGISRRADVYLVRNLSLRVAGSDAFRYALGALREQQARQAHDEKDAIREEGNIISPCSRVSLEKSVEQASGIFPAIAAGSLEVIEALHGEARRSFLQERLRAQMNDTLYCWAGKPGLRMKN
jgi:hypothetical protein